MVSRKHRKLGNGAKAGEAVYQGEGQGLQRMMAGAGRQRGTPRKSNGRAGTVALHLDFVAKPQGSRQDWIGLEAALGAADLSREGLESSILLVSDREARLVTLLTFWDAGRFLAARESRIAWMQKVLAPFADGCVRAHTSVPQVLTMEARRPEAMDRTTSVSEAAFVQTVAG